MRRLVLLIALVLTMGTLSTPPAAAYQPPGGAVFNTPPPWGNQPEAYRIIRHVEAAIRNVPRDLNRGPDAPEVLITSYLLDRRVSVDALIEACRKGASVRVIIDKAITSGASVRLAKALNGDNVTDRDGDGIRDAPETDACGKPFEGGARSARATSDEAHDGTPRLTDREAVESIQAALPRDPSWGDDQSYLTQCRGSCRGAAGSMHTKFYAFSHTGTARNVVMVSSSNLNAGGAVKGWNDLYTMKQRPATYAGYENVHDELGRDRNLPNSYSVIHDGPYTSRFFPMETASKANDPTLNDLNKVRCGSDFGRTRINIAMFFWASARGNYLLDRVLQLARQGCQVNTVIGAPSLEIGKRLRAASRARLIKVWDSRKWTGNRQIKVRTHNKYVAIKGTYAGDRSAHLVMTGSQNWGHGSLAKSDDSTLNIELASAYGQYVRHWAKLRRHSIRMAAPR